MNLNKILVIGETCVDTFVYGTSTRISPEANAPVFVPKYSVTSYGMATNVANNIKAMGFDVDVITNTSIIKKTRYVNEDTNELYLRVDENDEVLPLNLSKIKNIESYLAVVISDYCKGFLTTRDIEIISKKAKLTILDTKKILGKWSCNVNFIKLNRIEAAINKDYISKETSDKLLITLDKHGCMYNDIIYPCDQVDNPDVSGAGDTFVAGFITNYLKSGDIIESIKSANKCSGKVICNKGVSIYSE
jgi:D-beta-D-heptose 7-phosphate kinase/D-beta-D-heptose 1-phosphate adenosyltransferase